MVMPSVVDSDGDGVAAVVAWGWGGSSEREGSFWRLRPVRACLACVCMHV